MKYGFFHRAIDGVEMVGYGATTAVAGTTTFVLTFASAALLVSGVGVPGLLITLPLAAGAGALTVYTGSKTNHKAHHLAGIEHSDHSATHVKETFNSLNPF